MRGRGLSRGGGYGGGRGGGKHPQFLKGKDIGMFYKNRSLQKRKQIEKSQVKWLTHPLHSTSTNPQSIIQVLLVSLFVWGRRNNRVITCTLSMSIRNVIRLLYVF